ncbi:hypothetical protein TMLG_01804 [Mycobacterium tuberculosis SUMu012]|nr:hypothetical protein TMLG_01804 [Mycobacterium tuberculosis SUMu012]
MAPGGPAELPPRRAQPDPATTVLPDPARRAPEPIRRDEGRSEGVRRPPPAGRNGQQATNYQH